MPALIEILADSCRKSPFWAFAVSFTLFLFSQLILLIPFTILILSIYGVSPETDVINRILQAGEFYSDNEVMAFRIIMGGSQLLTWGLAGILMAGLIGKPEEVLRLKGNPAPIFLALGALILCFSIPLVQLTTLNPETFHLPEFLSGMEDWILNQEMTSQKKLTRVLSDTLPLSVAVNIIVFAILPAISEELFFRGFLQKNFGRAMNVHLAIWLTALIFSLVHFQFYGFFSRLTAGSNSGLSGLWKWAFVACYPGALCVQCAFHRLGVLCPSDAGDKFTGCQRFSTITRNVGSLFTGGRRYIFIFVFPFRQHISILRFMNNLYVRSLTALVAGAVAVGVLISGVYGFWLFCCVISLASMWEFLRMTEVQDKGLRTLLLGLGGLTWLSLLGEASPAFSLTHLSCLPVGAGRSWYFPWQRLIYCFGPNWNILCRIWLFR